MRSPSALPELVRKAERAYRENRGHALTTEFVNGQHHALELLLAARKALGESVVNWEPESLWLQHDFSLANRDKLQAAKTLATHPTLFTEPRGFAAIAQVLADRIPDLTELNPAPAEVMAWAVLEGELIFSLANASEDPEYSPDVIEYVALSLLHKGFVVAPDLLEFADEQLLLHLSDEGQALRPLVQKAWKALTDDALEELSFPESAEGVQLARLAAVQVYCDNQARTLLEALP